MPNTASAAKRMRQSEARRVRNKSEMSRLKTQLKKFNKALEAKDAKTAEAELRVAIGLLDRASKHRVIHDNQAARRKSRLQQKLNALATPAKG